MASRSSKRLSKVKVKNEDEATETEKDRVDPRHTDNVGRVTRSRSRSLMRDSAPATVARPPRLDIQSEDEDEEEGNANEEVPAAPVTQAALPLSAAPVKQWEWWGITAVLLLLALLLGVHGLRGGRDGAGVNCGGYPLCWVSKMLISMDART